MHHLRIDVFTILPMRSDYGKNTVNQQKMTRDVKRKNTEDTDAYRQTG
jgi:hypothetical protein